MDGEEKLSPYVRTLSQELAFAFDPIPLVTTIREAEVFPQISKIGGLFASVTIILSLAVTTYYTDRSF